MRKKSNGFGVYGMVQTYAGYGMTEDRAKALLAECRAGKYTTQVQMAAQKAAPGVAKWLISSIIDGKSFHDMEIKWQLGEEEIMPCCRNSFYAYRKFTLAILDGMLSGRKVVNHGQL